jgi:hypothetical protein
LEFTHGVTTTNLWALQLMTDGRLMIQDVAPGSLGLQGTLTGTTPLANDTWYTIRIAYDAAAGGIIKVWLDGSLDIDASHTNAGTVIEAFEVSDDGNACQFDDFYLIDVAKPPPLGQIVRLFPDGVGGLTEFTTVVGNVVKNLNVDELIPNDDTDYNAHADSVATDLYSLDDPPAGWINAVKPMWRMKQGNGSGGGTPDYAWRIDGTDYHTEFVGLDGTWQSKEHIWAAPPEGNGWWTGARVTALELGAKHNGTQGKDTFITWTTAMVDYDATTTAVTLTSFTAIGEEGSVVLEWETGSEIDNLGFNLYRATSEEGPYAKITPIPIPGLGSSPAGARYSHRDTGLTNGVTYYYKLEDIETTGRTEMHGPVSATPEAGAGSGGEESSGEGTDSRITVGDPTASEWRIVEQRADEIVLELLTGGFYALPNEDGTVQLEIPDFVLTADDGYPTMPVRRTWVPIPAGRNVSLASVETYDEEVFGGLKPENAGVPVVEASPRGTVQLRDSSRIRRVRQSSSSQGGLYPAQAAQLLETAFQQDVKKALAEMAPLRWDANRQQLRLAHRLVVRLVMEGYDLRETTTVGVRGRRYRRFPSHETRRVVARLLTQQVGLYGVSYEEIFGGRGRQSLRGDLLRLSRQGESVPFYLEGSAFGPGTTLYFMSEGAAANPYGNEAVYELETGVEGVRMPTRSAAPSGTPTPYYWASVKKEENTIYQTMLVNAPDRWLWSMLFAPVRTSFPFELSALAPTAENARLSVVIQGASDFIADPDHHVQLYVNGTHVAEAFWNGKETQRIDVDVDMALLLEGENVLEVENVGDTAADYSMVMLNRFELDYPRLPQVTEGRLEGRWSYSGTAEVAGTTEAWVLEKGENGPIWLTGAEPTPSSLRFRAEAERHYLIVSPDAVQRVTVEPKRSISRLKYKGNGADYLVVGPRDFLTAARSLFELRRRQGLRVKAVSMEEVFSEFGFGEENPRAIKDLLAYAYHQWLIAPRYVLLLGDATYDYKGYLGTDVVNHVPPLLVLTSYLETASDPAFAAVNGDDILPDLAIGRLPAANVEQVSTMVEKIVAFETGTRDPRAPVVLVADNPDGAGNFDANADELASTILALRDPEKINLSRLGTTMTRQAILDAFDGGATLISYIGHGGIHMWADENVFNSSQVESLWPQTQQPLLLTLNCLNGYFHFPYFDSLSEALVKAEGKGAVAAFSPSGLSLNGPAHLFHKALLTEIFEGGHERLGDAVLAAQSAYADKGAFPELLSIYHLLGDPALTLR